MGIWDHTLQRIDVVKMMAGTGVKNGFWFTQRGEPWCYSENWLIQEDDPLGTQKGSMPLIFRSVLTFIYLLHIAGGWTICDTVGFQLGSVNDEKWQGVGNIFPSVPLGGPTLGWVFSFTNCHCFCQWPVPVKLAFWIPLNIPSLFFCRTSSSKGSAVTALSSWVTGLPLTVFLQLPTLI